MTAETLGRHLLPGPGAADRPGGGGLLPGRGRPAAPRHGQEEARGDGGAEVALRRRRRRPRGIDRAKAAVLFDQIAEFAAYGVPEGPRGGLRADRLPDRLSQGEPSARVPGGAAHHRVREPRQALALHRALPRARHRHPAAGRERVEPQLLRGGVGRRGRHPLRLRGHQERGCGGGRPHHRGARVRRPFREPLRLRRPHRRTPGEPPGGRSPGEVRRLRRTASEPQRGLVLPRRRAGAGRRRPARPFDRPGEPVRHR